LLIVVVAAGALIATPLMPAWSAGLTATLTGPKPRVFWSLGRSSAFVALGWLWLSMVLGLMMTNRLARRWPGGPRKPTR
jgi:hypothetical protein